MKKCELCNSLAKMYCESDEAMLCWDCDSRVHGANFLVAKHLRTLLCHLCQSPTPWNGSGPKLDPTVSACSNCVNRKACREEMNNNEETLGEDDDDYGDVDKEEDDWHNTSGDEENQVVPWLCMPPVSSYSTGEECSKTRFGSTQEGASQSTEVLSLKRMRDTVDPASRDHSGYSFCAQHQSMNLSNESASLDAFGSLKGQKITVRDSPKGLQNGMVAGDI